MICEKAENMNNENPVQTTYKDRLMFYELCVARTRWYGAALAAALAYSVGGLVQHPTALALITVGIVLAGVTLSMHLFMYETEVLKIQRIGTRIGLDQPLAPQVSPAPMGATFYRLMTWHFISIIAIVVVGDRTLHTFLESSTFKSPSLELYGLVVVAAMAFNSVIHSFASTLMEVKRLNRPSETSNKVWWNRNVEITFAISLIWMASCTVAAIAVWILRNT